MNLYPALTTLQRTTRTVETFEEFDADGKLVKRTVRTIERPPTAPAGWPYYSYPNQVWSTS